MSNKKLMLKAVTFSSMCGILTAVILCCLLAAVMMSSGVIPTAVLSYCAVAIFGISALLSGIIAARITKSAGLVVGTLTGFVIFVTATAVSLSGIDGAVSILTLMKLIFSVLCGGLGGIIGVNKKEKIKI